MFDTVYENCADDASGCAPLPDLFVRRMAHEATPVTSETFVEVDVSGRWLLDIPWYVPMHAGADLLT